VHDRPLPFASLQVSETNDPFHWGHNPGNRTGVGAHAPPFRREAAAATSQPGRTRSNRAGGAGMARGV